MWQSVLRCRDGMQTADDPRAKVSSACSRQVAATTVSCHLTACHSVCSQDSYSSGDACVQEVTELHPLCSVSIQCCRKQWHLKASSAVSVGTCASGHLEAGPASPPPPVMCTCMSMMPAHMQWCMAM